MSGLRFRVWCLPLLVGLLLISVVGVAQAQPTVELIYDDNEAEYGYGAGLVDAQLAVRFSLPNGWSRARLLTAKYYTWRLTSFTVRVLDSDRSTDLTTPFPFTPSQDGWQDVDLSGRNIEVERDFYISLEYDVANEPILGIDTDGTMYERSWHYYPPPSGPGWQLYPLENIMIRAIVQQIVFPVPEFSLGIPIITSVSATLYLLIKQRLSNRKG